jgi:hypothetical protein
MPTEQLELRTNDPLFCEMGDQLVAEKVRIDPLRNARSRGVLFDNLS